MKHTIFACFLAAVLFFPSCMSRKGEAPRFYVLEMPADAVSFEKDSLFFSPLGTALLSEVSINPAFGSHQIAMREKSHELQYFAFNQWAVRPQESLLHIALQRIGDSGLFAEVVERLWNKDSDYNILVHVYNLEVIQEKNRFSARLHLSWELIEAQSGKRLVHMQKDEQLPMRRRDLNMFSQSISQLFVLAVDDFINEVQTAMLSQEESTFSE